MELCSMMLNIKNFNFERCNLILTPNIESILLASRVLKSYKNKKEVIFDLLSKLAPPIIQSCSTTSSIDDPLVLDDIQFSFLNNT